MNIPVEDGAVFEPIKRFAYARGYLAGVREALRRCLVRIGTAKFGERSPSVAAAIDAVSDVYRIEDLTARVLTATSWDDLLAAE